MRFVFPPVAARAFAPTFVMLSALALGAAAVGLAWRAPARPPQRGLRLSVASIDRAAQLARRAAIDAQLTNLERELRAMDLRIAATVEDHWTCRLPNSSQRQTISRQLAALRHEQARLREQQRRAPRRPPPVHISHDDADQLVTRPVEGGARALDCASQPLQKGC